MMSTHSAGHRARGMTRWFRDVGLVMAAVAVVVFLPSWVLRAQTPNESNQRAEQREQIAELVAQRSDAEAQGNFVAAAATDAKVLAIERTLYPDDHYEFISTLERRCRNLTLAEQFDEAIDVANEIISQSARVAPEDFWWAFRGRLLLEQIETLQHLSADELRRVQRARQQHAQNRRLLDRGEVLEARRVAKEALETLIEVVGDNNELTLSALRSLAISHSWCDDEEAARDCYQRAFAGYQRLCPPAVCPAGLPDGAEVLLMLAQTEGNLGNAQRKQQLLEQTLEMLRALYPEQQYPNGQIQIVGVLNSLAIASEVGEQELNFYLQALEMGERLFPLEDSVRFDYRVIDACQGVGEAYYKLKQPQKSQQYLQRCVTMCRRTYDTEAYPHGNVRFATALEALALVHEDQSNYLASVEALLEALPMYEHIYRPEQFPRGHIELVDFYDRLGVQCWRDQDVQQAWHFMQLALQQVRSLYPEQEYPNGHWRVVDQLLAMGDMAISQRKLPEAAAALEEALALCPRVWPVEEYPNGNWMWAKAISYYGSMFERAGQSGNAYRYYMEALRMWRKIYPVDEFPHGHHYLATSLRDCAMLQHTRGNTSEAKKLFEEALQMMRYRYSIEHYPRGHRILAEYIAELGRIEHSLGDLHRAEALHREAFEMLSALFPQEEYPNGEPSLAVSIGLVGLTILSIANYGDQPERVDEAIGWLQRELEMESKLYPEAFKNGGNPKFIYTYLNLSQALRLADRPMDEWWNCTQLGLFHANTSYPKEAYPHGHPQLLTTVNHSVLALMLSGHADEALSQYVELAEGRYDYLAYELTTVSADAMLGYVGDLSDAVDGVLSRALQGDDVAAIRDAYQWSARAKSIVLDALVRSRRLQHKAAQNPELANLIQRVDQLRSEQAALVIKRPAGMDDEQFDQRRSSLSREVSTAESQLMAAIADLGAALPDGAVKAAEIQAALQRYDNAVAIEIIRFRPIDGEATAGSKYIQRKPARYLAFMITPEEDAEITMVDLGPAAEIDELVRLLRREIEQTPRSLRFSDEETLLEQYSEIANDLYQKLFAPLRQAIGDAKTVFVSPAGELNRVALETLVDDDGDFLIEEFMFAYLSSTGDLTRRYDSFGEGAVVIADPDFNLDAGAHLAAAAVLAGDELLAANTDGPVFRSAPDATTRGLRWDRLPNASVEAEAVIELLLGSRYGEVTDYVAELALEEALKMVRGPRLLHLATHGYYLPEAEQDDAEGSVLIGENFTASGTLGRLRREANPLFRSGIVLAGANTPQGDNAEDGWVTAEEVAMLDLVGTELVVLSACETGLSDVRVGENVSGLRRAFLHAGAASVINSLYKVPDEATMQLMSAFYKELQDENALQSLHEAQLAVIAARRADHGAAHPFFWGSFVFVGQPAN